jgi:DnaJ-class molecular chaperone
MSERFVTTLRARGDALKLAPEGAAAITVRVEVPEIWDVIKANVALDQPISVLKSAALSELYPNAIPGEYVLKLRGWEVLDETVSVRDTGAVDGSIYLLSYRKRRPVR